MSAESVETVASQVDRLCWTGILLGLAFTMTNVQQFAAAGATPWSLPWLAAWLLDPMVSLVLLAILRAEQVLARHGVRTGGWVRGAKWFTLAATYVMNTWAAYAAGSAASVVLHSVPPLVVFVAAEAVTDLRDKLGEAAGRASKSVEVAETPRRTTFAEYLAVARAARTRDTVVTPAWVREVTGCSRGLSSKLAAALKAAS
ncbi:hypothetical protein [Kibdelosporangium aridum]|uniref:hypothetical protein n=1 Tax=Kibdelosporangium aridum TaxID=2030 RepID=UPI0035E52CDB